MSLYSAWHWGLPPAAVALDSTLLFSSQTPREMMFKKSPWAVMVKLGLEQLSQDGLQDQRERVAPYTDIFLICYAARDKQLNFSKL